MILQVDMKDIVVDDLKFVHIYNRYYNTVFSGAYNISNKIQDAEDITIEVFMRVIRILDQIDEAEIDTDRFKHLMMKISKNTALNYVKKAYRQRIYSEVFECNMATKATEDIVIESENYQQLMALIQELDEIYRDVFILRMVYQLKASETAAILNISEANVHTRLARARAMLQKRLKVRGIYGP